MGKTRRKKGFVGRNQALGLDYMGPCSTALLGKVTPASGIIIAIRSLPTSLQGMKHKISFIWIFQNPIQQEVNIIQSYVGFGALYFILFFFLGFFLFFCFFCFFFCIWHMEVSRLRVELELQLPDYTKATTPPDPSHICNPHHSSRQCQILIPRGEARDGTCVLMGASQVHSH